MSGAGVLAGLLLASAASAPGVLFTFADQEISESSGLVDRGGVVFTVNDSGAGPVLYGVDAATGETTSRTTYSDDEVRDVEALAPGRGGALWVGDIGDNLVARDSIALYRASAGADTSQRLDLTYPDGPRDAEALLAHPRTGRLFVVSKTFLGGTVYAVPPGARPGRPTTMRRFAQVPGLVTDGAFLPDGRHVVLRSYGTATVYTFPGFVATGRIDLPAQEQGEAIAIGADGRVLISSEGVGSDVLEVALPARLTAPEPDPTPDGSSSQPPGPEVVEKAPPADPDQDRDRAQGMWSHPASFALRVGLACAMVLGLVLWWRRGR
ncbi:MAG: hypothetical protein WBQ50_04120 [Nocardioides sp.]